MNKLKNTKAFGITVFCLAVPAPSLWRIRAWHNIRFKRIIAIHPARSVPWCIRRLRVILWCSNRVLEGCAIIHPVQFGHKLCKWAKKLHSPAMGDLARSEYLRYTGQRPKMQV